MNKIVKVAVTNDLTIDQRVHKVCLTLGRNGFAPHLIGVIRPNSTPLSRKYKTTRIPLFFQKKFLFYAEFNLKLFFHLLFSRFDIVLSNDTDTLPACFMAAIIRRKKIVFDAHELYTEIPELVDRPFIRKVWQKTEDLIIPRLRNAYTVCQPIADIYKEKNGINMKVIRNAPFSDQGKKTAAKKLRFEGKKILLYQGAVNMGRGIEWIIDAMQYVDNAVFYIIGDGDIKGKLEQRVQQLGVTDKVIFLGRIPFEELYPYTISADLGISLLENKGLNYYYSLPNRIFDFVQAEVPILATDFPEIRNVVQKYNIGTLVNHYDPVYLSTIIKEILEEWNNNPKKKSIFEKAKKDLCWENEEKTLIKLFKNIS